MTLISRKIDGHDPALARTVGKRLVADDLLRTSTAPRNIRMDLDNYLRNRWNDGRVALGELWDYYTRYPYLPRMKDRTVLDAAVRDALSDIGWEIGGFALAHSYDPDSGDFLGSVLPPAGRIGSLTDETLLVAPHLALTQHERDESKAERKLTEIIGENGGNSVQGGTKAPPMLAPPKPEATRNARFVARLNVDVDGDIETQLATVAREVLAQLQDTADVFDISISIEAERFDGVVRTVSENCRTIGFSIGKFEDE